MVRMKETIARCLALSCVSLLFSSCDTYIMGFFTEFQVRKDVVMKWQGKDVGIRNHLNIDGFFCGSEYIGDSCVSPYADDPEHPKGRAFFDDGTFVAFESCKEEDKSYEWDISIYESGLYTVSGDTLVMEGFMKFDYDERMDKGLNVRFPVLRRFKIIDRNTLEYIDSYSLYHNSYSNMRLEYTLGRYLRSQPECDRFVYSFRNTYIFPTNDIKMKKKKWMWENKEDWKEWNTQSRERRKEKRTYKIKYWD